MKDKTEGIGEWEMEVLVTVVFLVKEITLPLSAFNLACHFSLAVVRDDTAKKLINSS